MIEKHCQDCGTEARPKSVHPSSLRTELVVWAVALAVGAGAGLYSVATSTSAPPAAPELQRLALASAPPAVAEPAPTEVVPAPPDNPVIRWVVWGGGVLLKFLRWAWWVLPIPIAFSLWRQFSVQPGCVACGSRRLETVPSPFDF